MGKKINYVLNGKTFETQKSLRNYLNENIREKYSGSGKVYVNNDEHIADLRYFLQHIYAPSHPENFSEIIKNISLENCKFFVNISNTFDRQKKSTVSTRCLFIESRDGKFCQDFSVTKFTQPSTLGYLKQRLHWKIMDIHNEIKREKLQQHGESLEAIRLYTLRHKNPSWDIIVQNFIDKFQLNDKLDLILVKQRGDFTNENIANFTDEYQFLDEEFVIFYQELRSQIDFELEKKKTSKFNPNLKAHTSNLY